MLQETLGYVQNVKVSVRKHKFGYKVKLCFKKHWVAYKMLNYASRNIGLLTKCLIMLQETLGCVQNVKLCFKTHWVAYKMLKYV